MKGLKMNELRFDYKNDVGRTEQMILDGDYIPEGEGDSLKYSVTVVNKGARKRFCFTPSLYKKLAPFGVGSAIEVKLNEPYGSGKFAFYSVKQIQEVTQKSDLAKEAESFSVPEDRQQEDHNAANSGASEFSKAVDRVKNTFAPEQSEPPPEDPEQEKWNRINAEKQDHIWRGEAMKLAVLSMGNVWEWTDVVNAEVTKRALAIYTTLARK